MQLNIYVPKEKARIVDALDEAARQTGRPKSELALEALEVYLAGRRHELGIYHLGEVTWTGRDELYLER